MNEILTMTSKSTENEHAKDEVLSKTQIKQEAEKLKKLGLELVELTKGERDKVPLEPKLLEQVELATRINRKKDGFRRQNQLIGKLLRGTDVEPIQAALIRLKSSHIESNRHFHELERLRDLVLQKQDDGINHLLSEYPELERQKLRQLLRLAQKQEKESKPPTAAREIFQYLKSQIPQS